MTANRSNNEASVAYREMQDQINSLSSILSFYLHNHDALRGLENISDLTKYIENHFTIIEEILKT